MKIKSLIVATALLLSLGAGTAHATEATPTPEPTISEPAQVPDPTLIVVLTPPYLGADGQIVGPSALYPELSGYFTWWVDVVDNAAIVTASVIPGSEVSTDLTLTDRSGAVDVIVFDPIVLPVVPEPVVPEPAPAPAPVPAPVVPAPTLEEDEPGWNCETMGNGVCGPAVAPMVAAPAYAPDAATSERVAAGEELAYTGVNVFGLGMGAALMALGVFLLAAGRQKA